MTPFKSPQKSLGDLDAEAAATLIATAADIAIIVDDTGAIRDLAVSSDDLGRELESLGKWEGRPWADTVTAESRPKIAALLHEATSQAMPRWRQVNHPSSRGVDVPVSYSAVLAGAGRIVVFGRDLRALSELQQRLVDAQQSLERDYSRLRHVETRYRLLFEMSREAVLILDAATFKVLEANPAARRLLGDAPERAGGSAGHSAGAGLGGGRGAGSRSCSPPPAPTPSSPWSRPCAAPAGSRTCARPSPMARVRSWFPPRSSARRARPSCWCASPRCVPIRRPPACRRSRPSC